MAFRSRVGAILLCAGLSMWPVGVAADDPAVVYQLYGLDRRFEVTLTPTMSVFDKYTRHVGMSVGVAYFITDYFGLEVEGGYAFLSDDRKLFDEIVRSAAGNISPIEKLPLKDLKRMTWWAMGGLVFSPLYGKLNLSAELAVSVHVYLVGGAGAAEYHYSTLDHTKADPKFDELFGKVDRNYGIQTSYYFGGGLRFHFGQHWSLRFEVRDVFFFDEYKAEHKPEGLEVREKTIKDFVHNTFIRLGVCYAF